MRRKGDPGTSRGLGSPQQTLPDETLDLEDDPGGPFTAAVLQTEPDERERRPGPDERGRGHGEGPAGLAQRGLLLLRVEPRHDPGGDRPDDRPRTPGEPQCAAAAADGLGGRRIELAE